MQHLPLADVVDVSREANHTDVIVEAVVNVVEDQLVGVHVPAAKLQVAGFPRQPEVSTHTDTSLAEPPISHIGCRIVTFNNYHPLKLPLKITTPKNCCLKLPPFQTTNLRSFPTPCTIALME